MFPNEILLLKSTNDLQVFPCDVSCFSTFAMDLQLSRLRVSNIPSSGSCYPVGVRSEAIMTIANCRKGRVCLWTRNNEKQ